MDENEKARATERFEDKFCRDIVSEYGIHQIGIVDPWKTDILRFIFEEFDKLIELRKHHESF